MASRKEQREEARKQREEREAEERKKQRRKRRIWQIGAALVAIIAIIVVAVAVSSSGGGDTKASKEEGQQAQDLFSGVAQSGTRLGNPEAKVTIYEFADLQCPFCKQFSDTVLPELVTRYVKPGKVKMEFRNLTFLGADSVTGARAAAAAGAQNKLWTFQELFYKNQGAENSGYVTDKFIEDLAKQSGVDPEKLKADMGAPFVEQQLGQAQEQANEFGVDSTPSFLIQVGKGKPQRLDYEGFEIEQFAKPIDEALERAGSGGGS